jgi:hypothetical protein
MDTAAWNSVDEDSMKLIDIAKVLRSKNAGPSVLTLDLMFERREDFESACRSPSLTPARIAPLYGVEADVVHVVHFEEAFAIKIRLPRKVVAGSPGDRDVYGAQQHGPLLDIVL